MTEIQHQHIKERYLEEGIPHYGYRVGDIVEAKRKVLRDLVRERGEVEKYISARTRLRIADIVVSHRGQRAGFDFLIVFDEFPGEEYKPKRFRNTD